MSKSSEAVKQWRHKTKQDLVDGYGGRCYICGYGTCNEALEIHHINPEEKDFSFGYVMAHATSREKLANEAIKCVLLCSNCHKEVHYTDLHSDVVFESNFDYNKFFVKKVRYCKECGCILPRFSSSVYCSRSCRSKHSYVKPQKVNISEKELLEALHKTNFINSRASEILGVSDKTVAKKRVLYGYSKSGLLVKV